MLYRPEASEIWNGADRRFFTGWPIPDGAPRCWLTRGTGEWGGMRTALALGVAVLGLAAVLWGATDTQCWWESDDVQVCVGTGTGLGVAVAGGVLLGVGVTSALAIRRGDAAQ